MFWGPFFFTSSIISFSFVVQGREGLFGVGGVTWVASLVDLAAYCSLACCYLAVIAVAVRITVLS